VRGIVPGGLGDDPGAGQSWGGTRGRVAMVVRNAVSGDSRVRRSASALAAAGWDVTVIGTSPDELEHRLELDGVPVVLVPVPAVLTRYARARVTRRWPEQEFVRWWGARQELARRDAALRGRRPLLLPERVQRLVALWFGGRAWGRAGLLVRAAAGAVTPGGGWRLLDRWVQEVELALAPLVEALEPDVIHAHDHHTAPLAARSTAVLRRRGHDVRWVHDAHELSAATADRGARGLRGLLRRRMIGGMLAELVPSADAVVTVSGELAERLHTDLRLRDRPAVVLNAPPVASGRPAPFLRERAGVRAEDPLLVYAGGLTPSRGVDLAVRALTALAGVHLALVAPDADPHVAGLRALADGLGVGERLHVVPYVAPDQVVDYLGGADAGLVPLRHRPNHELSLVTKYMEYAQARLPLVVSDVRVMAAFTREHGFGEVFRVRDGAPGLATAARTVLADPGRYRAAYDAAADVLARLTWEEQSGVLTALYEHIARPAGSRTPAV
jgi:glycogen(starch) synthase